jgi:type II secretory pathway component PulM
MIKEFWAKLNTKQRYYVAFGIIFVLLVVILEFGIFPLWEARDKIKRSVQTNQKRLGEIILLDAEFTRQEAKLARVKKVMAARPADYSLFSYLEKKAVQAGVKGNIKNMNSSRGTPAANYEESLIDIKLDKITIKQLTDFLYYAESPSDLIRVKRITISKMKESPEYLSAQMQLATFQVSHPHPGGR